MQSLDYNIIIITSENRVKQIICVNWVQKAGLENSGKASWKRKSGEVLKHEQLSLILSFILFSPCPTSNWSVAKASGFFPNDSHTRAFLSGAAAIIPAQFLIPWCLHSLSTCPFAPIFTFSIHASFGLAFLVYHVTPRTHSFQLPFTSIYWASTVCQASLFTLLYTRDIPLFYVLGIQCWIRQARKIPAPLWNVHTNF